MLKAQKATEAREDRAGHGRMQKPREDCRMCRGVPEDMEDVDVSGNSRGLQKAAERRRMLGRA